jgi:hypothetical protein
MEWAYMKNVRFVGISHFDMIKMSLHFIIIHPEMRIKGRHKGALLALPQSSPK